ncbi:hypothetical protein F5H01DRAFT_355452 [Linnemannia elongata]|nr:hypothetical protein F5H01DRAFT_355452 [Linnemannia elongata]
MGVFLPLLPLPLPPVGVGTATGADETVTGTEETGFLADEVLVDVGLVDDFEEPFPELELELLLPPLLWSELLFPETTTATIAPMMMTMMMFPTQMIIFRRPLLVDLVTDPVDDDSAFLVVEVGVSTSWGTGYERTIGSGYGRCW